MKLPKKVTKRRLPKGSAVVLGVITGFAAGAGVVLRGREAAQKAARAVLERAELKG